MKIGILIIFIVLACMEGYIIQKTTVNKWLLPLVEVVIALPIGSLLGLHLVVYPIFYTLLTIFFYVLGDWLKKYFRKKRLTEVEQSRLHDL